MLAFPPMPVLLGALLPPDQAQLQAPGSFVFIDAKGDREVYDRIVRMAIERGVREEREALTRTLDDLPLGTGEAPRRARL